MGNSKQSFKKLSQGKMWLFWCRNLRPSLIFSLFSPRIVFHLFTYLTNYWVLCPRYARPGSSKIDKTYVDFKKLKYRKPVISLCHLILLVSSHVPSHPLQVPRYAPLSHFTCTFCKSSSLIFRCYPNSATRVITFLKHRTNHILTLLICLKWRSWEAVPNSHSNCVSL